VSAVLQQAHGSVGMTPCVGQRLYSLACGRELWELGREGSWAACR